MVHALGAIISLTAAFVIDVFVDIYKKVANLRKEECSDEQNLSQLQEYQKYVLENHKLLDEIEELSRDAIQNILTKRCVKKGHGHPVDVSKYSKNLSTSFT